MNALANMDDAALQEKAERRQHERHIKALREELAALERKQMPASPEVEQTLLGAILRHNTAYDVVSEFLRPEHFYVLEHSRLYEIIREKIDAGDTVSPASLSHIAESDEVLNDAGGQDYLYELVTNVVTVMNAGQYGRIILDLARKRELILLGEDIVASVYESSSDIDVTSETLLDEYGDRLTRMEEGAGSEAEEITTLASAVEQRLADYEEAYRNPGQTMALRTGLTDLDRRIGGLKPHKLYVIAGRPAMGKSAFLQRIARGMAQGTSETLLIFSKEMDSSEIADREIQYRTGLDPNHLTEGRRNERDPLTQADFDAISNVALHVKELQVKIDSSPAQTLTAMSRVVRRENRKNKVGAVMIDYLQIVEASQESRGYRNRVSEVSEMTRAAKQLAKQYGIPVILLSQLSREVEKREDKRPLMADLRDSGSIEQDADVVLFLYRAEYYLEKEEPERRTGETPEKFDERYDAWEQRLRESRNILEVITAKQRGGRTGTDQFVFDRDRMNIDNLQREAP